MHYLFLKLGACINKIAGQAGLKYKFVYEKIRSNTKIHQAAHELVYVIYEC